MNTDDLIKSGKESWAFGPDSAGKAICHCGRTYQAFTDARDQMGYEDGSRPSVGPASECSDCRFKRFQAANAERLNEQAREEYLRNVTRPVRSRSKLSPEAFREACEEWVGVRRIRPPARVRNRCACGLRAVDKFLRNCARCRDAHHRRRLRHYLVDLPFVRYPDLLAMSLKAWPVAQEEEFQPLHDYIAKEASCRK